MWMPHIDTIPNWSSSAREQSFLLQFQVVESMDLALEVNFFDYLWNIIPSEKYRPGSKQLFVV